MLTLIAIFGFITSFSQIQKTQLPDRIKVGEIKSGYAFIASLTYSVSDGDTTYTILYDNNKYTKITDIQKLVFNEDGGVLNSLYQILSETIEQEKGKRSTIKLGEDDIAITAERMMGVKYVDVMNMKDGSYFSLTQRQLNKLFRRK